MRRRPLLSALQLLWFAGFAWLSMGTCWGPSPVRASDVRVLVVARDEVCASLARRTQAEARAADFVVSDAPPQIVADAETDLLVALMEQSAVQALVLLSNCARATEISVLVIDPVSGRDHFRRMDRRGTGEEARVALQAVEVLRAAWLETGIAQPSQPSAAPSQPALPTSSSGAEALPSATLSVASGVTYSPGGVFATWKVATGLELYSRDWLGVALDAAGTPWPARVRGDRSLTLRHASLSLGPVLRFAPSPRARVWVTPALGGALMWGALGRDAAASWAPIVALRVGAGYALTRSLTLRANVAAQSFSSPLRIEVDGDSAARFGVPVLDATLGFDLALR